MVCRGKRTTWETWSPGPDACPESPDNWEGKKHQPGLNTQHHLKGTCKVSSCSFVGLFGKLSFYFSPKIISYFRLSHPGWRGREGKSISATVPFSTWANCLCQGTRIWRLTSASRVHCPAPQPHAGAVFCRVFCKAMQLKISSTAIKLPSSRNHSHQNKTSTRLLIQLPNSKLFQNEDGQATKTKKSHNSLCFLEAWQPLRKADYRLGQASAGLKKPPKRSAGSPAALCSHIRRSALWGDGSDHL